MIKPQMKVAVDADVQKALHDIGSRYGMSGNAIVAAAAYELSRVRPENLWSALGRIAQGENASLVNTTDALPESRRPIKKAIPT